MHTPTATHHSKHAMLYPSRMKFLFPKLSRILAAPNRIESSLSCVCKCKAKALSIMQCCLKGCLHKSAHIMSLPTCIEKAKEKQNVFMRPEIIIDHVDFN